MNPLFKMAVLSGAEAAVLFHIRRGVDLNATDSEGRSPLMLAAIKGHNATCKMLLESGSDPFLIDKSGKDALALANINNRSDIASLLASYLPHAVHPPASASQTASTDAVLTETGRFHELEKEDEDFSLWEEQLDSEVPPHNEQTSAEAGFIQFVVSGHRPIDTAEDWDDVDIDLPELTTKGRSQQLLEEDARLRFRTLVLAGLNLGSVPLNQVESLASTDRNEEDNIELKQRLSRVFDELGILIDDTPLATSYAGIHPDDTIVSDLSADDAVHFLEDLTSAACDPLNQYMKDLGPRKILSREEEAELGRAFEDGIKEAVRALANCSAGFLELLTTLPTTDESDPEIVTNETALLVLPGISQDADVGAFEQNDDAAPLSGYIPPQPTALETTSIRKRYLRSLDFGLNTPKRTLELEAAIDHLISLRLPWRILQNISQIARVNAVSPNVALQIESALERARQAREQFTTANLRLVYSMASKYLRSGMDFLDLVQEGNIGLLIAIERYDFRRGFKFSTYAIWWIKQSITRAVANSARTIRIPVHIFEKVNQVRRAQQQLWQELHLEPPPELLAARLDLPVNKVVFLLPLLEDTLALDQATSSDLSTKQAEASPEELVFRNEVRGEIDNVLRSLSKNQRAVIELRFGLRGADEHTLEEIGQEFGLTRERIRQIEAKAIRLLRHAVRSHCLRHAFGSLFQEQPQHLETTP